MRTSHPHSRREFLVSSAALLATAVLPSEGANPGALEPIIDIHQHTGYSGRTDQQLLAHQRALGVATTILLPAGSPVQRPSTHDGKSNGLDASCGGIESVRDFSKDHSGEFRFFANEVPDLPGARRAIEKWLKRGALGIGEQKFNVECDSKFIDVIAELSARYHVPVLLHFQHATYNKGIERFHKVLERHPKAKFIGHAQTWWGNIDLNHVQTVMYPTGKVTPGGITDRLLSDYPNMFGDLSAGSGLNSLLRDEEHTRAFLERHQDKLLFGTDCNDVFGRGPGCQGSQTLATLRRLCPSKAIERKILYQNAKELLQLDAKV